LGWQGLGLNRTSAERLAFRVSVGDELEIWGGMGLVLHQTSADGLARRVFVVGGVINWG